MSDPKYHISIINEEDCNCEVIDIKERSFNYLGLKLDHKVN